MCVYETRKRNFEIVGGERGGGEITPCTECTYVGTKMDQSGDNKTNKRHSKSKKGSYKCFI